MMTKDIKPVCPLCKTIEPKLVGYEQNRIDNIENKLILLLCQHCNGIITALTVDDAFGDS